MQGYVKKNRALRSGIFIVLIGTVLLCAAQPATAGSIKLSWDLNHESDLAGYKVYFGTASRAYGPPVDVGKTTTFVVSGLTEGKAYYFSITAYDSSKNESAYSSEVSGVAVPPVVHSKPPCDYDGDGKTDISVWRPSEGNWYIIRSSDGETATRRWGSGSLEDVPVPGDYDGDGKTDMAFWRPREGNWYIIRSSDGETATRQWGSGSLEDVPVPGDYDGDGKADMAFWRPGEGNWYIIRSSDEETTTDQWGAGYLGDVPLP